MHIISISRSSTVRSTAKKRKFPLLKTNCRTNLGTAYHTLFLTTHNFPLSRNSIDCLLKDVIFPFACHEGKFGVDV